MLLRALLEDISKNQTPHPSYNTNIKRSQPLRKAGTPVRAVRPRLLQMPPEVRNRIYDFLPDSTITLYRHRLIEQPKGPIGYDSPPESAGHVYHHFQVPAQAPFEDHEWDTYSVLADGSYGITLTHRILRQDTLVRVLENAKLQCDDDEAIGVFNTVFPKLWRPHLQVFAGWIQKGVPAIPTDSGYFPNLRKIELNVPVRIFEEMVNSEGCVMEL